MTRINAADEILRPARECGLEGHPALIAEGRTITYRELTSNVNHASNAMRALGIAPGDRVMLMLNDSPELVAAYLGAMLIGAVAIAFNTRSSPADLAFALEDSDARLLLIDLQYLAIFRAAAVELKNPRQVVIVGGADSAFPDFADLCASASEKLAAEPMTPDAMAFWVYTSGTTGRPKAAVHRQRDVLSAGPYLERCLGMRAGDRLYSTSRLFFAYALGNCLFGSLRLGATTVLDPRWPDGDIVAETIERARPQIVFSVPTLYRNLLASGRAGEPRFATVRAYASAGERLPAELAERWQRATGVRIFEGMGTSETIYMIFSNSADAYRPGSSGKVAPGVEVKLIDERDSPINEPGQAGALWIKMDSTCDQYWNQPEVSQRAFSRGWFRAGDLYSFDIDGFWYHHGRADEMLKISGQWVSPAEIEECTAMLAEVADAAAVGISDADGLMRLTLAVVPRSAETDHERLAAEIRATLISKLSIYKCPRDIRFVDRIPRTATGKVQRFRVRDELAAARRHRSLD